MTAVDRDGPPYNRFIYTLLPLSADVVESPTFVVDRDSGAIRTTRALDRERQGIYRLTAVARELAYPRASSTANVNVFVADRNDNAPVILQPQSNRTAVVSLYASPGHVFARVTAVDSDRALNARLRYSIVGGNHPSASAAFHIGAASGAVSVRRDLGVILPPGLTRMSLDVVVRDSGIPPLNATTTLDVVVDRSSSSRRHGGRPPGDRGGHWLTSLPELRREFLILLAAGSAALIVICLIAIVCVLRRRQLATLAAGGADQIQPRRAGRDDAKSLPPIVEVGWTCSDPADGMPTTCRRASSPSCDPEFQIVRNIVDSPGNSGRRRADREAPWKAATLQSPSRMMSAACGHDDDPALCHAYVTSGANTTGRMNQTPQLQTFSVSSTHLLLLSLL